MPTPFADHCLASCVPPAVAPAELGPGPTSAVLFKRQQAVVAMGRRTAALPELPVLIQDAAQLMAEMLDADYGAVAECVPDAEAFTLRLVKHNGDAAGAVQTFRIPATPKGSMAGYTLHERRVVLVDDLSLERRFDDPLLRRLQVRSAISIPLALHECGFGVLAALATTQRTFHPQDMCFGESVAHLLTTTMARKQSEDLLANQRRMTTSVLDTIDALVLELGPEGRIRSINRAGLARSGFATEDVRHRPMWSVFCRPEEADALRAALGRLKTENGPIECQSLLVTKQGEKRRIAWTCGPVRDQEGHLQAVIATGIDISDRIEAERRACLASGENTASNAYTKETLETIEGSVALVPSGRERRTQPRKPYPYQQLIAPVLGRRLPSRSDFTPVTCHDISPGGFSFMSPTPPESGQYVVALGRGRRLTYVIAQVAHMTRLEQDGERKYLVGCNYVGRADY
jgi:PAS domain S-box-containing protein